MTIAVFGATDNSAVSPSTHCWPAGGRRPDPRASTQPRTPRRTRRRGRGHLHHRPRRRIDAGRATAGRRRGVPHPGSEVGKRLPQHRAAIDAAVAAGVRRITYTSAPRADVSTLVLAPEHKATEEYLAASGLTTTILRDGWYTENYQPDFGVAQATGVIANSVGATARIASAPRTDFAEAAAIVLTTDGHDGKVYEVSGDTA